jgi:NADPH:quinone reductase-like Zn-dependent oxidoreductase
MLAAVLPRIGASLEVVDVDLAEPRAGEVRVRLHASGVCHSHRDAGRYFPIERLALSPQCGFSTSIAGNSITVDDERGKLETIARTPAAVWGGVEATARR